MEKLILSHFHCQRAIAEMAREMKQRRIENPIRLYAVPRGGIPVAYLLLRYLPMNACLVDHPKHANCIIDDIVDSGRTRARYEQYSIPFLDLVSFLDLGLRQPGQWVVFPWEMSDDEDRSAEDIVLRLLQYIGEDPVREGLQDTPKRVLKAWKEWTSGYEKTPEQILKSFEDGSEDYDEMVVVRDLPFYSTCEHHLAPFFGSATIAYIPNKRIVGLSKLGRLLNMYSRRLQVQERLTTQIADALQTCLEPRGVGVVIRARHLCMESRGICCQGHHTITSALRGVFREDSDARREFLALAKG